MANESIKVSYRAFDQPHEEIFPKDYKVSELATYLRGICHSYVITDIVYTSKKSNIISKENKNE